MHYYEDVVLAAKYYIHCCYWNRNVLNIKNCNGPIYLIQTSMIYNIYYILYIIYIIYYNFRRLYYMRREKKEIKKKK